jgi:acyl-CoA thioesterase FadM
MKKYFFDKIKVFFKHTDYFGVVHPYNYLEWTSYIREAFFVDHCKDFINILESDVKMMTTKIHLQSLNDSFFGDDIVGIFSVDKIRKVSFDVIIRFHNKTKKTDTSLTRHTLVFLNEKKQVFTPIPMSLMNAIQTYQEEA